MILEKIREKSYYIPFIITIILIMMSILHLNATLTNRLQNTTYIDIMFILGVILFLCVFAIIIILPIELLFFFQTIINFISKNIIQLKAKANKKLYENNKQGLIKFPHQKNILIYKKSIENNISPDSFPINTASNDYNTVSPDSISVNTASSDTINYNINNTGIGKAQNKEHKLNIAKEYITETFSEYCSEEDIKNICNAIKAYSNGENNFLNYSSISVKNLKPLDLYHFGWNIWKHFRIGKQDVIAELLKRIFLKLSDTETESIKKHLKDEENKGKITIKEDLSKPNEQKK